MDRGYIAHDAQFQFHAMGQAQSTPLAWAQDSAAQTRTPVEWSANPAPSQESASIAPWCAAPSVGSNASTPPYRDAAVGGKWCEYHHSPQFCPYTSPPPR